MTLALTIGDVNGIGPEVALKTIRFGFFPESIRFVLIGPRAAWEYWADALQIPISNYPTRSENGFHIASSEKTVIVEPTAVKGFRSRTGFATKESGYCAASSVETAVRLALAHKVDAIVTAPLSKAALRQAGLNAPGHTEMLARLSGIETPVMLLVASDFRVAVATTHLPLKMVAESLTTHNLIEVARVLLEELREKFAISSPRLAVCGLNPHAGESGTLGNEESDIIAPAIEQLRGQGHLVEGPFPADALFSRIAATTQFDAFLAMYHDQGLIPVKMRSGGKGVNYTCGLPFVRTSPDHGTGFDIAGKGVANASSMMEAVQLAIATVRKHKAR